MDGLIINQPYAEMIIDGEKIWELRSRKPPAEKINSEIFLLSKGNILGTIKITNTKGPFKKIELDQHYEFHKSDTTLVSDDFTSYAWILDLCKVYSQPKKYRHPNGARVWVKDVLLMDNYLRGKITNYF